MRTSLYIAVITLAAIVGVALVAPYFAQRGAVSGGGNPALLVGAPAASFPLQRLDGATDGLSNYRGQVVLVNLWASWCAPCRAETPALERLYRAEKARGLVVLGIDQGEDVSTARDFARTMGLTYPVLLDQNQSYSGAFYAGGLPTTIIVDRSGRIAFGHDGPLTFEAMSAAVRPLVGA